MLTHRPQYPVLLACTTLYGIISKTVSQSPLAESGCKGKRFFYNCKRLPRIIPVKTANLTNINKIFFEIFLQGFDKSSFLHAFLHGHPIYCTFAAVFNVYINMKNKPGIWIGIVIVLILMVAGAVYYIFQQKAEFTDLVEQSELYKEELADEYNDLSIQYEGYKLQINNDSLVAQLETEQLKVQRLQDELRTVKATDAKRINELKKELETLRKIMRDYVAQIDSLDRLNKQLTKENRQVSAKYQEASQTVSQLTQEKEQLIETVQIASKLDASNISVTGLTNKNKATDKIKKMDKLEIRFTIHKNITATSGEKTIYIRIQKPDDDVLVKNSANLFTYENKKIHFSEKRTIEYTGEEIQMSIFWQIEEFLAPGTYRVDIFADGNLIGRKSFQLDK
ncbi:MAG: hypothetical protein EZS26_000496 [Candidatus Ordinivivax streblomastigis]|uniref:Chromosome segregation protein SMC n=1 Tax=Candidatus Ordinivivax streblomastigis TaxID=2540710 RepID=A0A5M8P4I3_9BACT|nr:MAG: hypothetical protein EZS26_000471 [Candidatus Ordinivivax streblomastigis]KAA6303336.1 MAG: hypothetical protein EZS26_000496 [Candidatus Ordinivivax streblomastigis]